MAKNWDYEILKAASERKPETMVRDEVYLFKIMGEQNKSYDMVLQRARYLDADGLIELGSDPTSGHAMVKSITPEGRVVLERMENNRWQRRIIDWFIGFAAALLVALASAIFESLF